MNDTYRQYNITLETVGPVFVGSGNKLSKKSYVFSDRKHVDIIDLEKMYMYLKKRGLAGKYEKYLLEKDKQKLASWLDYNRIDREDIKDCVKYSISCGDAVDIDSNDMEIVEHVKDSYGKPYIPGSSIKGMLRTILLTYDILSNSTRYETAKANLKYNINGNVRRNVYLNRDIKNIETMAFNRLKRDDKKIENAVNDIMSGIIISDSEALGIENLVLCKKIEGHTDGKEHSINIMRECIKPGCKINFTLTVDRSLCNLDDDKIYSAIRCFSECYNEYYISSFKDAEYLQDDYVILGGGSGYVSKTIMYPLYGKKDGVKCVRDIFVKTVTKEKNGNHKNVQDVAKGISPHIIKYTNYNGKCLQMGICKLTINN